MKIRFTKTNLTILAAFGVVAAGLAVVITLAVSHSASTIHLAWLPPSDNEMIAYLHEQQAEFNELVDLYSSGGGNPGESDQSPYEELRIRLGMQTVSTEGESGVLCTYFAVAVGSSTYTKGYLYSEQPPGALVDAIDIAAIDHPTTVYRHIEDQWYLFFRWEDTANSGPATTASAGTGP